jgi:hypothetical protein
VWHPIDAVLIAMCYHFEWRREGEALHRYLDKKRATSTKVKKKRVALKQELKRD